MNLHHTDNTTEIRALVLRERLLAVSEREWLHRLRGYGYAMRDTAEGRFVTSVLRDAPLCRLT